VEEDFHGKWNQAIWLTKPFFLVVCCWATRRWTNDRI